MRARCSQVGHALGNKLHDGDRWIAAAAIRLGIPLVSHNGLFDGAPVLSSSRPSMTASSLWPCGSPYVQRTMPGC
ncbi:hypothetical protein I553_3398 [Mycobacterium xenopi 4042]|uniref:Uncharacterized protein n=1 Tax=Mycobacterium xenopi 4042 TaxID=1299334 RepID=X8BBI2_MYCXE|nr:hypothetical protein I553_3398 [Mycobacterium xenopi 4042]